MFYWVIRFSKEAIEKAKDYHPSVGDVWLADETVVKIGGRNVWFWDIIDRDIRDFCLASHISRTRTIKDAQDVDARGIQSCRQGSKEDTH